MLAELDPVPDQVTVTVNTSQMNVTDHMEDGDVIGTSRENPKLFDTYKDMIVPANPLWVEEHVRRLSAAGIQSAFQCYNTNSFESVERLMRRGFYKGPLCMNWVAIGGGMANTFLYAQGHDVGASYCEKELAETAREIIRLAGQNNCKLFLPIDIVVQPAATRRKKLFLADMDSTMIGQECIDELADFAGIKDQIAALGLVGILPMDVGDSTVVATMVLSGFWKTMPTRRMTSMRSAPPRARCGSTGPRCSEAGSICRPRRGRSG